MVKRIDNFTEAEIKPSPPVKMLKLFSFVVALAATLATSHAGVLIGVQFKGDGTALTSGQTAGVVAQANWNVQTTQTAIATPLLDSTGATTGVIYTLSASFAEKWNTGTGSTTPNRTLLSGKIGNNAVPATLSINLSGLTDGTGYDFYLYTVSDNNTRSDISAGGTTYYITDQNGGVDYTGVFVQGTSTNSAARTTANYVKFSGLASSGGNLTISINEVDYHVGYNGFQIQAVPEPATWALLAFSLTSVVIFRRRRLG